MNKNTVITNLEALRNLDVDNYRFIKKDNVLYGIHKKLEQDIIINLIVPNTGFISYYEDKEDVGNLNKAGYEITKHLKILSAFLEKIREHPYYLKDYKAIHINSENEIILLKPKEEPDPADAIIIEDADKNYTKKKVTIKELFYYIKDTCPLHPYVGVSVKYNNGGVVFPNGLIPVKCGSNLNISITPDEGYRIKNVILDYHQLGPISSIQLEDIQEDHTVEVIFEKNLLTIEAHTNNYGTIYPQGKVKVEYGENIEFLFQPLKGYEIEFITVDGITTPYSSNKYVFSNVKEDHNIYVSYRKKKFTIVSSTKGRGLVSPSGTQELEYGDDLLITIEPDKGYTVQDVIINGNSQGSITSYKIIGIDKDYTIEAIFEPIKYDILITINDETLGTAIPNGRIECTYGSYQTITFVPNEGAHVLDVIIDGISQGNIDSYTFSNITSNHEVFVKFRKNTYSITASASSGGSINPNGIVTVEHGNDQTFTISPLSTYDIQDVIIDGKSLGPLNTYTFTDVKNNHSIVAIFQYKITGYSSIVAISNEGGLINPSGQINVKNGNDIEFTIAPNDGYHISNILVDGNDVGPLLKYKFENVNSNHTIQANFEENPPNTITITSGDDGNVEIHPKGSIVLPKYESLVFTITPQEGYEIKDVIVDNTSMGPISHYRFDTIDKNHTIYALGVKQVFVINALSTSPYGLITPNGQQYIPYGESISFVMTPNEGYKVKDVKVDGISQGEVYEYTFANVNDDHSIEVEFEKRQYKIIIINNSSVTSNPAPGTYYYEYGNNFILNLSDSATIICDNVKYPNQTSFGINGINSDHTIVIEDNE